MRICLVAFTLLLAAGAGAQDWPQWRGPARDGAVSGFAAPAAWPETLTPVWTADVGTGYATPLVVDGNLWQFARWGEEEVLYSLDPETGEVRWRSAYPAPFDMSPATQRHGPGPKSTPAYAAGRLFVHGMTGSVSAFDAAGGQQRLDHLPVRPVPAEQQHPLGEPFTHIGLNIALKRVRRHPGRAHLPCHQPAGRRNGAYCTRPRCRRRWAMRPAAPTASRPSVPGVAIWAAPMVIGVLGVLWKAARPRNTVLPGSNRAST